MTELPVREGNADIPPREVRDWWRDAVVYQIYPRSFADSDGDGLGDLPGIRSRLPYLAQLGVDAIWLSPFYPSPLLDGGYDVIDPRDVDPRLGTVDDLRGIVADSHELGLRVFVDVVPNHFSWEHPWFKAALATAPGSPEWDRFHAVRGKGPEGELPPNNWHSAFGGPAWTPIPGHAGWWYLHLFDTSQPDLNWANREIHEDFQRTLRFWFDLGVDGFRIDVAHSLVKAEGLPDGPVVDEDEVMAGSERGPAWDQPGVHDVWREWRRVADSYDPPRVFVGEAWVATTEAQAAYTRPDELHTTFNFHFLRAFWDATVIRDVIGTSLLTSSAVGAPPTWVLSNHDVWRPVTRFAPWRDAHTMDIATGRRRAVAMSMLSLALPGSAYLYQGEELGLPEVVDLPDEVRQDPTFFRTEGRVKGRDGCRVPIPWSGDAPPYGFTTGTPWLPQPADWAGLTAEAQEADDSSTLALYRRALRVRRESPVLGDGELIWRESGHDDVLAVERPGERPILVLLNTGDGDRAVAVDGEVLLHTGEVSLDPDGALVIAPDTCCWIALA
ncbi:MAG: alpha-amylase family glycosyl hydrolase [Actinomycetales bacterium]|nr:alpha-amylase family glycosyl hydrolase [Actinomycetales bacterium]